MELPSTRISARSQHQALDWSLVLVSQGIESIPDFSEEGAGWGLVIAAQDYERARAVLHQYQLENRRWPWRHEVVLPGFLFDWAALAWAGLLGVFFWLSTAHSDLRVVGLMDSTETARGQWWRLFTAIWLHADVAHLATNATLGFLLLGLAMGRYGTGIGLLAAYLAGAGGNLLAWGLSAGPHRSLGASGMVMASLGLLAVPFFSSWRRTPHSAKRFLSGVFGGLMLFVLLGVAPGTDILAHLGGFLSGLLLGSCLALFPNLALKTKLNLFSGLLFAGLVIGPWWLALNRISWSDPPIGKLVSPCAQGQVHQYLSQADTRHAKPCFPAPGFGERTALAGAVPATAPGTNGSPGRVPGRI